MNTLYTYTDESLAPDLVDCGSGLITLSIKSALPVSKDNAYVSAETLLPETVISNREPVAVPAPVPPVVFIEVALKSPAPVEPLDGAKIASD